MKDWKAELAKMLDKFEVTSGEEADVVVCRLITEPLYLPDNVVAQCSECLRLIQHRPHAPKKPAKVCDECAIKHMAPDATFVITEQSKDDLRNYLKKKRH